jgi:hypothetical protein
MQARFLMALVIVGAAIAGCNKEEAKPTPPIGGNSGTGSGGGTDATSIRATTRPSDAGATTGPLRLGSSTTQPSGIGRPTTGPTTKP